jgi:hypothetical protein
MSAALDTLDLASRVKAIDGPAQPGPGAARRSETWLLVTLLMGLFIANVDTAVVNVAAPSIRERLAASGSELQLVVSGYVLSYAMLLITGARLGAMYGYRRLFLIGIGVFTAASLACGLATGPSVLIVARIVQGVGAALLVPQVLTGIQVNFSGAARTRALGFYTVALSIGAVAGQILGGVLVSADLWGSGWRPIFLINLPIGAGVAMAALRVLPEHEGGKRERLDLWGVASLSLAVLLIVLPLTLGHTQHWPAWTWVCLAASAIPLMAFVIIERRIGLCGGHPLIDLDLVTRPAIAWTLAAYGLALATYFSLLFTLALFLQQGLGKSALYSGLALVSWVAAFGIGGPVVPHVPSRFSRFVAPFGYLVLAASYGAIAAILVAGEAGGPRLFVLLGFGGLGLGIGVTATIRQMTAAISASHAPDMSGLITTTGQIAGVAGIAIFGTAYFSLAPQPGPGIAMRAFAIVVTGFAVTALLAAVAAHRSGRVIRVAKASGSSN